MPESGEEKSFPATPKRRADARKQGQVARSPEFSGAVVLLALVTTLHVLLPGSAGLSLLNDLHSAFSFNPHQSAFDLRSVHLWQMTGMIWASRLVLPVVLVALVAGVVVNIGQVGFAITPEALAPKWERVNPASGIKRLLSMHATVDLLKGILKMSLVGWICYSTVRDSVENGDLLRMAAMPLPDAISFVGSLLWSLGLHVCVALFLLAAADFGYQKYEFEKNLKMSLSEIKQEMKQQDGDPHVKGKIRRLQREMAKKRMMQAVPKATVVITNPTHFAVALQYEDGASAPKVVAKGQDFTAQRIKELAREHNVPIVENVPLARNLYKNVEIGQEIPGDLYEAVAQVLAFVYRSYGRRRAPRRARA